MLPAQEADEEPSEEEVEVVEVIEVEEELETPPSIPDEEDVDDEPQAKEDPFSTLVKKLKYRHSNIKSIDHLKKLKGSKLFTSVPLVCLSYVFFLT